jgi:hypothetical protein
MEMESETNALSLSLPLFFFEDLLMPIFFFSSDSFFFFLSVRFFFCPKVMMRRRHRPHQRTSIETIASNLFRIGKRKNSMPVWGESDHVYKAGADLVVDGGAAATITAWSSSSRISLEELARSNVSGLLELLLTVIPFVLPQLGVPSVLLLRLLRDSPAYQGPYGSDHPLSFSLDDVAAFLRSKEAKAACEIVSEMMTSEQHTTITVPLCSICTCEADVVNLPCAHRTWCGRCASTFVAPPSAPSYLITTCHLCHVRVDKMILLASS